MMNLPEKEFSQLSNEEAKEQLLSILPEDEKTELETYDIFYFDRRGEGNWEISEGNPKVWMLRGKRVVPDHCTLWNTKWELIFCIYYA